VYETYEHQNQEVVMPKLALINLVLPSWKDPMQMKGNGPWVFTPTPLINVWSWLASINMGLSLVLEVHNATIHSLGKYISYINLSMY
jgi:hypothetical protein